MCDEARLHVAFWRTLSGAEPTREWLRALSPEDKRTVGVDIATVQYGWPVGEPLVKKLEAGLWEVR